MSPDPCSAQAFFRESYGLGLAAGSCRLSSFLAITHTHTAFLSPPQLECSSPTPLYPFSPFPNSEHRLPFRGAHLRGLPSHVSLPSLFSCLHFVPCPCLLPSTTLDPYTHLSVVAGSHEPLLHPCMVGPLVSAAEAKRIHFSSLLCSCPLPLSLPTTSPGLGSPFLQVPLLS